MGMLGQALTLMLLLLLMGHWGQGSADHVIGLSGKSLWLWPPNLELNKIHSVKWKVQFSSPAICEILTWSGNCSWKSTACVSKHFNNKLEFICEKLAILIKGAQQQDSGSYILEVTNKSGKIWKTEYQVSVLEPIEKPNLQWKLKDLDDGTCQLNLSCSVSRDENVNYAWYKGKKLIQPLGNLTHLVEHIDVNGLHMYTCNVSNSVSWANNTLILTRDCLRTQQNVIFPHLLVIIFTILLAILCLGTLISFCVWRRKRKQSRKSTEEECRTVYELINHLPLRRNQEQEQEQKQNSSREDHTVYSRIQSQNSASLSPKNENTIYSTVQSFQKEILFTSGCEYFRGFLGYESPLGPLTSFILKLSPLYPLNFQSGSKKNHGPSSCCTVYAEVGKRQLRAQNPARLSRRELENFDIYS
ncbi:natural killer cell receptor 2B4 isoform 2-T2 [Dugong dugon]